MNALYILNTDELNETFLQTIQILFPHKTVKLAIHEVNPMITEKKDLMDLYASDGMALDYDYKQSRSGGSNNVSS